MKSINTTLLSIFFMFLTLLGYSQKYIVSQNNTKSNEWVIVWGGKPSTSYGAEYMVDKASSHLNCNNVIYADYQVSKQKCDEIIKKVSPNGVVTEVYGFSRGGYNAFMEIGKVKYVWLIDPLIPQKYDTPFGITNVFMVYNPSVWDGGNSSRLKNFSTKLKTVNSVRVDMSHLKIPNYFFNTYR